MSYEVVAALIIQARMVFLGHRSPTRKFYPVYLHLYRVTAWSGNPANLQPEEHDSIQWFSLDLAMQLNLAHPAYPQLFARYLSHESNPGQDGSLIR